jgi:hypothetical protein
MNAAWILMISLFCCSVNAADLSPNQLPLSSRALSNLMNPNPNGCDSCSQEPTAYHLREVTKDFSALWAKTPCRELFATTPPALTPKQLALLRPIKGEWWPVCSLSDLSYTMASSPKQSLDSIIKEVVNEFASADACAADPSKTRNQEGYTSPTRENRELGIMDLAARKKYENLIEKARQRVMNSCCGGNTDCRGKMSKIPIVYCKPEPDPKKPDPCIEDSTYYFDEHGDGSGELHVSPLFFLRPEIPSDDLFTLGHEFGHACSDMLRLTAAKTSAEVRRFNKYFYDIYDPETGEPTSACKITSSVVAIYRQLFKDISIDDGAFGCLLSTSRGLTYARFKDQPCYHSCPARALDESFADAVGFLNSSDDDPTTLYNDACSAIRDHEHPFPMDDLKCLLSSPKFRDIMSSGLGCER